MNGVESLRSLSAWHIVALFVLVGWTVIIVSHFPGRPSLMEAPVHVPSSVRLNTQESLRMSDNMAQAEPIAPAAALPFAAAPSVARGNPDSQQRRSVSVVYAIFPSTVDPQQHAKRVEAIVSTWGRNQYMRFFGPYDAANVAMHTSACAGKCLMTESQNTWKATPPADAHSGTREIMWALELLLSHEGPQFDFIFYANDVTFVVPENVQAYACSLLSQSNQMHYLGRRLTTGSIEFNSGGAGFLLSRRAVESVLARWKAPGTVEEMNKNRFAFDNGDIGIAQLLSDIGVKPQDTRDKTGAERFNVYGPVRSTQGAFDNWVLKYTPWYQPSKGISCCSVQLLSFHYIEADLCRTLHDMLHDRERWKSMSVVERLSQWPQHVGGYERRPAASDTDVFTLLLQKVSSADTSKCASG